MMLSIKIWKLNVYTLIRKNELFKRKHSCLGESWEVCDEPSQSTNSLQLNLGISQWKFFHQERQIFQSQNITQKKKTETNILT